MRYARWWMRSAGAFYLALLIPLTPPVSTRGASGPAASIRFTILRRAMITEAVHHEYPAIG